MSMKYYTTKTASLKATRADIRKLETTKIMSDDASLENINASSMNVNEIMVEKNKWKNTHK